MSRFGEWIGGLPVVWQVVVIIAVIGCAVYAAALGLSLLGVFTEPDALAQQQAAEGGVLWDGAEARQARTARVEANMPPSDDEHVTHLGI
jgi:hypothetical protein